MTNENVNFPLTAAKKIALSGFVVASYFGLSFVLTVVLATIYYSAKYIGVNITSADFDPEFIWDLFTFSLGFVGSASLCAIIWVSDFSFTIGHEK